MNIEQQRQWAYIALRATATPPLPTTEQMAQRIKDRVIVPYQFIGMPVLDSARAAWLARAQAPFVRVFSVTQNRADLLCG